jgi:hypothetical protein
MRFITAVSLATVMLWVPVDGVAQEQEVTITAVEIRFVEQRPSREEFPFMTFETRNNTPRTIVAWRGNLQIRNPFEDVIWEGPFIFGDEGDLAPNRVSRQEHLLHPYFHVPGFDLKDYEVKDMILRWTDLQVVYSPR